MPNDLSPLGKQKVPCKLVGESGNAYSIIARVAKAMRKGGYTSDEITAFKQECMSSDYDHILQTVVAYVCDPFDDEEE